MKSSILFVTMVSFASAATATCVCSTGIAMYKYPGGAALIYAIRYETGDCEPGLPGQCQRPTNVYDYRTKGHWEIAEHCPNCRPYGPRKTAVHATESDHSADSEHANQNSPTEPTTAERPEGISVDDKFNPLEAGVLPYGSRAEELGFFILRLKDKMASDSASTTCVKVGQDIEAKIYRVRFPRLIEEQIIAYQINGHADSAKEVGPDNLSQVHFEPRVGDRILTLQISHQKYPEFKGKTVLLFRAK